ncbi:MAG TPA: hypothetical protein VLT36_22125 [Candidatus Dormibacteraeota bacterium]|nr:hypothetical protein [Candidatus Dormibacteraeota bacterium]
MTELQAKVRSVDAIEAFRSALIVFLTKARPTLEEVTSEVVRTRMWLQNEQRQFWEKQVKVRRRELEQAQAELFSARISKMQEASAAQQMAVHRAHRAIQHAEDKLRVLKRWERELDNRAEPMIKLIEQLHGYLTTDMSRGVVFLGELIKSLQAYAETGPAVVAAAPQSATGMPEQAPESTATAEEPAPAKEGAA